MPVVDLHSHTVKSDGLNTPTELVRLAREAGVDILAITDHETTDGLDEAKVEAAKLGLRIVPGIEVTTYMDEYEVHLLGYGLDYRSGTFQEALEQHRRRPIERIKQMCQLLGKQGFHIDADEVVALARRGAPTRNHIAKVLHQKGLVRSNSEAFIKYLRAGALCYVSSVEPEPDVGVRLIRAGKGVPVIAHPGWIGDDGVIAQVVAQGAQGLEVYHTYEDLKIIHRYLELAKRYRLLITGGSDWHGNPKSIHNARLGEFTCPYEEFLKLEKLFG